MEKLKELRRLAGWTQTRTAARSGVNRAKLGMVESGEISLNPEEESAVRKVLLAAVRERESQIRGVLANAEPARIDAGQQSRRSQN
jgi:transcriptional regulator with XRE-family HTH domain